MKVFILSVVAVLLSFFSGITLADKIILQGEPFVVEQQGAVYVAPSTVVSTRDYYYLTVGDSKRVCYKTVQPGLAKLDLGILALRMGNETVSLHCYTYSPDYFTIP